MKRRCFSNFMPGLFILVTFTILVLACGGGGGDGASQSDGGQTYDYTTTYTIVKTQLVEATAGAIIEVDDPTSFIYQTKLTIPARALSNNTTITISEVNNPPALPDGYGYVGVPIDFKPDGTTFSLPVALEIFYSDTDLSNAGISDATELELFTYNISSNTWEIIQNIMVDTVDKKITAELSHFSPFMKVVKNARPPSDLGNPQPGDLVFNVSPSWLPGHVGVFVGEKTDPQGRRYNVIEALPGYGVVRTYYNPIESFGRSGKYLGAREPRNVTLTTQQRERIVFYVETQADAKAKFAFKQTNGVLFGMAQGPFVKGPEYNCVGLAEAAYEFVGVNDGDGLVPYNDEVVNGREPLDALTVAEMYSKTKPASGVVNIAGTWNLRAPGFSQGCTDNTPCQASYPYLCGRALCGSFTMGATMQVLQSGTALSSSGVDGNGQPFTFSGSINNNTVVFTIQGTGITPGIGPAVTTYIGTRSGNAISGTFSGSASWTYADSEGNTLIETATWGGTFTVTIN